ncbi:AAA family ATPase [Pseudonocardia sp. RS010]|uniref:AAA family ATPase n=1 Tax=Pseudonocardia sp. RS010 TaxID=3385979 RepID=UPI00399FBBC5
MRITVGVPKGGAGKTTTAVHLAIGLSATGRTLLVDTDPDQHAAVDWSNRAVDWPSDRCTVIADQSRNLRRNVEPLARGFEHVIFDTGAKNEETLRQAMNLSDYLIVPSKGTDGDLLELPKVFRIAAEVDISHPIRPLVLLTQIRGGTNEDNDARSYLEELELPVFDTSIPLLRQFGQMRFTPLHLGEYSDVIDELFAMDKEVSA